MKTYPTKYGDLKSIATAKTYPNGRLRSCMLNGETRLATTIGEIVPQYRSAEFGERQKKYRSSLDFYDNGEIKSASLDRAALLRTPLGPMKAELVTFYQDGTLNRIFPLNGLIDGFWSETNERDLAEVLEIVLPGGSIRAKVISLHFYPSGAVKSITLWPGEVVTVNTPLGPVLCRTGLAFYENGAVRSVEPSRAIELETPVGPIMAYDPDIIGMHADQNSVQFSPNGELTAVSTIHSGIIASLPEGREYRIEPFERESYIDAAQWTTVPMTVVFTAEYVRLKAEKTYEFSLSDCTFSTFTRERVWQATCKDCPDDETCCKNGGPGVGDTGTCCGGGGCGG